jgi:DNA (cytosine-5)-methyltransferase 1
VRGRSPSGRAFAPSASSQQAVSPVPASIPNAKLRVLSLFAGIGGFDLGLERTGGFETVAFCEIDPFCQRVLAKHWPGVPCYDDVRTLTADRLAADGIAVDVICGGFPCQDISVAGRRAGMEGEHSGLWAEMARLVRQLRPSFLIVENSPSLCVRGLSDILRDLADVGYDAEWEGIPAMSVGAGHLRARQWIVAYPGGVRDGLPPHTVFARRDAIVSRPWRHSEPRICGANDGLPNRPHRLRALGNAVVPQIPELIGRAILASVDTRRMAETTEIGSVRSTGSAVPEGETPQ